MSAQSKQRQLIICGFHRSGTSLTMQALHNAGLRLGERLVAATPANPDGHFEDRDIVALHNDVLASHCRQWDSPGPAVATIEHSFSERAKEIIAHYEESPSSWGFKDPRTCLFLEWWHSMLMAPAAILVYRDYLSCFRSLRHRQAQQIAINPRFHQSSTGFWSDPSLPLQLWLDHNRCLLDYLKNHPDNSLLISHGAMLAGFNLPDAANERFDLSLDSSKPSGIRLRKASKESPLRLASHIPRDLLTALNATQDELDELAVTTTIHPMQWIYAPGIPHQENFEKELTKITRSLEIPVGNDHSHDYVDDSRSHTNDERFTASDITGTEPIDQLIERLQQSLDLETPEITKALISAMLRHHPTDVGLLINVSKKLVALREFQDAERHLLTARILAPSNVQILIQLASLERIRGDFSKASSILQAARAVKPPTAYLMTLLGNCLLQAGRIQAASAVVKEALVQFSEHFPLVLLEIRILMNKGRYETAIEHCLRTLESHGDDLVLLGLLGECLQESGHVEDARAIQREATLVRLRKTSNYHALIDSALSVIESAAERRSIEERILLELGNLAKPTGSGEKSLYPLAR